METDVFGDYVFSETSTTTALNTVSTISALVQAEIAPPLSPPGVTAYSILVQVCVGFYGSSCKG